MASNGQTQKAAPLSAQHEAYKIKLRSMFTDEIQAAQDVEKKIVQVTNEIDDEVIRLDNRMDVVLEQHERDFLSAYRKHMIEVQQELNQLKAKGTDAELQLK